MKIYFVHLIFLGFLLLSHAFSNCVFAIERENLIGESNDTTNTTVTISIRQDTTLYLIPEDFLGFSYETSLLTNGSDYLSENNDKLIQLFKNLGQGVLRVGGNTSDRISWTNNNRTPFTGRDSLTTTDIDQFSDFAKAVGWRVIFGLNLGSNLPELGATEAEYVVTKLHNSVYALQIGNEPDLYPRSLRSADYKYDDYRSEWESYCSSVNSYFPQAKMIGPGVSSNNPEWVKRFANDQGGQVSFIDGHYYKLHGHDHANTWEKILVQDLYLMNYLSLLDSVSSQHHLPFHISECNSVSMGGETGISNVFASALWGLDFMWTVAQYGGKGVNFHGSNITTSKYSAIVLENGFPTPRPLYYAMLAFKYGAVGGRILPLSTDARDLNCSAYACIRDNKTYITIINKDQKDICCCFQSPKTFCIKKIARLIAPSPEATSNVSFANKRPDESGKFSFDDIEDYESDEGNHIVLVKAFSAVVTVIEN